MKKTAFIFLLLIGYGLKAQVLTPEAFIEQVRQNHPVAKQAAIQIEKAKADLLSARGGFDPSFTYEASRKTFDGKNYYFYSNPELKIPTRFAGANIKTGLENNGGANLESEVTPGQSSYFGLELPVAKGLVIDKQRAALQQAQIYRSMSEQERNRMLNDLLFDAYVGYWQWTSSYQIYSVYTKFLQVSADRYRLVKLAFVNGDRSAIDTIEALTQIQNFEMLQADAKVKLNTASLELSNFLWTNKDSAYLLPEKVVPDTIRFALNLSPQSLEQLLQRASTENPILKSYDFKLNALEVERKLKFQNILPTVNLKANLLNQNYNVFKGVNGAFLQNNYNWGIDIKVPLFFREGRGDYRKAKLKIEETNYELAAKKWEIENKVRNYFTETNLLQQQIRVTQNAFNGFTALLRAENLRFQNGESSLFLINTRENKVIETAEKLISLRLKYLKANYSIEWSAGILR